MGAEHCHLSRGDYNVFFIGLRIRLWCVLSKTVGRNKTTTLRLQLAAPVRRRGVADAGDGLRGGGGMPDRISTIAQSSLVLRITTGKSEKTLGTGGKLPARWFITLNSAMIAAWLVVIE